MRAVKEVQSTMTTQSMPQTAQLPEAYGSLNLTRYASSEESTSSNCAASGMASLPCQFTHGSPLTVL